MGRQRRRVVGVRHIPGWRGRTSVNEYDDIEIAIEVAA
jgi:hypothetical protein